MTPVVQQIAREYKKALQELYGKDLAELVLFGSYARGDQHNDSDVDFAIVLDNHDVKTSSEIFNTAKISSRLSLKYGLIISSLPVSRHKKETSQQGVYKSIREEGIII